MKLFASPNSHRSRHQAKKLASSTPVIEEVPHAQHNRDIKSVDTEMIGVSEDPKTQQTQQSEQREPTSF